MMCCAFPRSYPHFRIYTLGFLSTLFCVDIYGRLLQLSPQALRRGGHKTQIDFHLGLSVSELNKHQEGSEEMLRRN